LAGLAAASALAERSWHVTLLESRRRLGGRASSFRDSRTHTMVDNCQHVAMGCCTSFFDFCRKVGLDQTFRRQRTLYFVSPPSASRPYVCRFRSFPLPAPLHLVPSLLGLRFLSIADRCAVVRGLQRLARTPPDVPEQPFSEWLAQCGQPRKAIEFFWKVVLVSALSESLDRISVRYARQVIVQGFLASRRSWEMIIPSVPLDELYDDRVRAWFRRRGVMTRLMARVHRIRERAGRIERLELAGGERLQADHYILAVPYWAAGPLLPEGTRRELDRRGSLSLQSAPIASIHLWFDRPITRLPHAVLVGRLSQWVFIRPTEATAGGPFASGHSPSWRRLHGEASRAAKSPLFYCQVIVSQARELVRWPKNELIRLVVQELADVWPTVQQAQLVHSRVIVEHRAVFSPLPGVDVRRPPQQTGLPNLHLAGDWTQTGWPSTMEGAVRSGYLAAESVLRAAGRTERVLPPDPPPAWLSQMMFADSAALRPLGPPLVSEQR